MNVLPQECAKSHCLVYWSQNKFPANCDVANYNVHRRKHTVSQPLTFIILHTREQVYIKSL